MDSKEIKSIKYSKKLCFKCLKEVENEKDIKTINFYDIGYGSIFDGFNSQLQLCPDCYKETDENLWTLHVERDEENHLSQYENETEIIEYISSLPLEGQELFCNRLAWGSTVIPMYSQDWIDYILNKLPHKKCKEYNLISPEETESYKERFEKCKYPVNITNLDGSKYCTCPQGSSGKYGQKSTDHPISMCHNCPFYEERKEDDKLLDLSSDDYQWYKIYFLYTTNEKKIREIVKKIKEKSEEKDV